MLRRIGIALLLVACVSLHAESTLEKLRTAGVLRCGINIEEAEYSTTDDHGSRTAFDSDLCRAVAVAVLGPQAKVVILQFPDDATSMQALVQGQVDLVATLTDDFSHSAGKQIAFSRPVLWDGAGLLVLGNAPTMHARQLSRKLICFLAQTGVEDSVRAWFAQQHLKFVAFPFQEEGEMDAAFITGGCGALAQNRTRLAETRAHMAEHNRRTTLLPETLSKDPLAAAVRSGDEQWTQIVNWVMEALVQAEESAVTRSNVRTVQTSNDPLVRQLLGGSHTIGLQLGLADDWALQVIEAVGNYGEIYERDLGGRSTTQLPRGENRLYTHGGLMMALPPK
jgi:general L-amino acid transport system substrate-binding protein